MSSEPQGPTPPGAAEFPEELASRLQRAYSAMGPGYRARTRHLTADGAPKFVNRLILETSPYLLQHAHNPVNWYPWGEEAFSAARSLGRPIVLSIGYSTCHWCHVMEEESFEDQEIATFINRNFVAIKVDREERPDIDAIYMNAVMLMNQGQGGWPMTIVMTPDGKPFFAGTYFPPREGHRGARLGFLTILERLAEAYRREGAKVEQMATKLVAEMRAAGERSLAGDVPPAEIIAEAAATLAARYDPEHGGFGPAPKFPQPTTFELLLRYWRRANDPAALEIVTHSLEKMRDGGIWDQIGGGFHRYSTDRRWLVPHFEKMLYDNAQLVVTALETYQATRDQRFAAIGREILDYVRREMTSPEGAFYSATDADSEGEEGRFFVWTKAQLEEVLGAERAAIAAQYWGITEAGNFEGRSIPHVATTVAKIAERTKLPPERITEAIASAKAELYRAREQRPHPLLDDKVLTEWNAQMISAFAKAAVALEDSALVAPARAAAEFIMNNLASNGRLRRAYRAGQARHEGVLEDYAYFVAALLDLFEATGSPSWLEQALRFQGTQDRLFRDAAGGGYFATASDGEALLVRTKAAYDGAQPSGNAVAIINLLRLFEFTGDDQYRQAAQRGLEAFAGIASRAPIAAPKLLAALDWFSDRAKEIVIVTTETDDGSALKGAFARTFLPNRVYLAVREGEPLERLRKLVPFLDGRKAIDGRATAYVCTEGVCKLPVVTAADLQRDLEQITALPVERKLEIRR